MSLQEQFPECFEKLMELFGTQEVLNRINRHEEEMGLSSLC